MSNDNAGRTSRTTSSSNPPMGSAVAIVVTIIALIIGFVVLKRVNDNSDSGGTVKPGTTTQDTSANSTGDSGSTTLPNDTTTTAALVVTGTKVQVANASHQNGVAKTMSAALGAKGFTMAEAVSAAAGTKYDKSVVLYNEADPNAKLVADSLATLLGGIEVKAQGAPVPVASGTWAEGSGVVLMLGDDYAGKTLDQIAGKPTTGTTTPPTSPGATAAPTT